MSRRELVAAGITDPVLAASYLACRRLNAAHGRTYFLATRLLPAHKRPHVHALYGFARLADEIVDDLASPLPPAEKAARLDALAGALDGGGTDGVLAAVQHTIERWQIPRALFAEFLRSMRMDLTVREYAGFSDLLTYVEGSAAVIGLQMLPILEPADPVAAAPYARDLGVAFQLSNFLRDVGEDLRRGRLYLPLDDLAAHGVTRAQLEAGVTSGALDHNVRRLLAFEIARTRALYRRAEPGIELLHPTSRDCIRTAFRLYGGILDEVEASGYRVLDRRVAVPVARRAAVALPALGRAWWARRHSRTQTASVAVTSAKPKPRSSTGA